MTANDVLEQAADPLDPVIAGLESVVLRLRDAAETGDGPAALDARAAEVRECARLLVPAQAQMYREATECDAGAVAARAVAAAAGVAERAAEAVRAAEETWSGTAAPEAEATRENRSAGHEAERADDALKQAVRDKAGAAEEGRLVMALDAARRVAARNARELARAEQARQAAREALVRARAAYRAAQDDLAAAEEAAAHPDPANLSRGDLFEALMFSFPYELFGDKPLSDEELRVCRYHATQICDDFGWTPAGAERRIRTAMGREMAATVRAGRSVEIRDDKGTLRLRSDPLGMAGASQVATVAQGR